MSAASPAISSTPRRTQETLLRQAAVKELLPQTELREKIALLGASRFQRITARFFDDWLADVPPTFLPAFRIVLSITAVLNLALVLAGFTHLITWSNIFPNLALTLCVQAATCLFLRPRVMPLLNASARLQQNVSLIADGLALVQATSFDSFKLQNLQRASLEPLGAVKLLKRLEDHLTIVEQRSKEWYYVLSLFLAAGTQTAISIAHWKHKNSGAMRTWLAAWAEFEALNALATYAFEHPDGEGRYCWPELLPVTHAPLYEARQLAHPLLVDCNRQRHLTRPRAPVFTSSVAPTWPANPRCFAPSASTPCSPTPGPPCAPNPCASRHSPLGASIALTDSLAEGRSKFLAEVERLSAILKASAAAPVLFLVDEIFSGTNSQDRRAAAQSVLNQLLANSAIGALSTHDLALTDLATPATAGLNVHMASPDPEDPLAFDYLLKPGINTASSAHAILRLIGIDTEPPAGSTCHSNHAHLLSSRCRACSFPPCSLLAVPALAADVHVRVDPSARAAQPGNENLTTFPTIVNALDHHPFATPNPDGTPGRVYIEIVPGIYHERVIVTQNHNNITLIGLGKSPADVVITNSLNARTAGGTFFTETVEINGTGFEADNITFENAAGNTGQAVAVADRGDRSIFKHCRFLGHQDTLFADYGRQYYVDSYIEGGVDYIFGNAAAVFDRDELHSNGPGFITAQSRTSPDQPTGYVILNSQSHRRLRSAARTACRSGCPPATKRVPHPSSAWVGSATTLPPPPRSPPPQPIPPCPERAPSPPPAA